MHRELWLVLACLVACGDDDGSADTNNGSSSSAASTDAETSPEDSMSSPGSMTSGGNAGTSNGATSAATTGSTSGGEASGGPEGTSAGDETASEEASEGGGNEGGGSIDVTLTGCTIDLGGTVVVTYNGSLGVASVYDDGASLTGSFQFDLDGPATMQLSSQHRVDTGTVVNMVDIAQGTWTNLDPDFASGTDNVGGTLDVATWNPSDGEAEIHFDGVALVNVVNGNVCTIDGTVVANTLYP